MRPQFNAPNEVSMWYMRPRAVRWAVVLAAGLALGGTRAEAGEVVVEGETLVRAARAEGGGVSVQPMSRLGRGWSGDAQLFWAAEGPNSRLLLSLEVPAEGDYNLAAFFTRAPDYGIVVVSAGGRRIATFDGFAARVARSDRVALGRVRFEKGPNPLTFAIEGRSTRSTGHFVGLDALIIEPASSPFVPPGAVRPADPPGRGPTTVISRAPRRVRSSLSVNCPLVAAPRPRGLEQREVLLSLSKLESELFARPGGGAWRSRFPFGELRSLASVPELGPEPRDRLARLLSDLDAMSLDPAYFRAMRDTPLGNLHCRVRDLAGLSKQRLRSPGPAHDLAAAEIYGTFENLKMVKWVLRIHVVSCSDHDGTHGATVTVAEITGCVALANELFAPAHLRFAFDPSADWETVQDTKLNRWDDAACKAYAEDASRVGKIVIFYGWGNNPAAAAQFAANSGTHIVAGPNAGGADRTFCHELGHFLGLPHTFPGATNAEIYGDLKNVNASNVDDVVSKYILAHGGTEEALDGDGFSDTPPDPGNDYWLEKFGPKVDCDPNVPTVTVTGPQGQSWTFTPDRTNLMSYFKHCSFPMSFTAQQLAAMTGRVEGTTPQPDGGLKRLLKNQVPWQSSSIDFILVGKVRNVGTVTSKAGRTAAIEQVLPGGTKVAMGPPAPIPPLAAGDWMLVKAPLPGGTSWQGQACLTISLGDQDPTNDTLCPSPYKAPQVK